MFKYCTSIYQAIDEKGAYKIVQMAIVKPASVVTQDKSIPRVPSVGSYTGEQSGQRDNLVDQSSIGGSHPHCCGSNITWTKGSNINDMASLIILHLRECLSHDSVYMDSYQLTNEVRFYQILYSSN